MFIKLGGRDRKEYMTWVRDRVCDCVCDSCFLCYSLSRQGVQLVCLSPQRLVTPSPGRHCLQHSPVDVYRPDKQSSLLARAPTCQSQQRSLWVGQANKQLHSAASNNNTQKDLIVIVTKTVFIVPNCKMQAKQRCFFLCFQMPGTDINVLYFTRKTIERNTLSLIMRGLLIVYFGTARSPSAVQQDEGVRWLMGWERRKCWFQHTKM